MNSDPYIHQILTQNVLNFRPWWDPIPQHVPNTSSYLSTPHPGYWLIYKLGIWGNTINTIMTISNDFDFVFMMYILYTAYKYLLNIWEQIHGESF